MPVTHLFDILHHDSLDFINLALDRSNVINCLVGLVRIVKVHAFLQDTTKFIIVRKGVGRQGRLVPVLRQEAFLHVLQKGVGDTVLVELVRHAEITNPVLHNVVKDMIVVDVGHFAIFGWNLG